jgi:3-oxoacyl-[acyl-carrier-protein] synthase-3
MSQLTINNVRIAGMSACVPATVEDNRTLPIYKDESEALKVIASTGIERHHKVDDGVTASDLTVKAVEGLLNQLGWDSQDVDCFAYVCTSRDYIAPQTSCVLQDRLNLRSDCCVFDLPFGCSGWVYGMSIVASMMSHGTLKRAVLVAAETNTQNRNPRDTTVRPLFGDAATATALEFDPEKSRPMNFMYGVDGAGFDAVWAPYGGMRNPVTPEALVEKEVSPGVYRRGVDMIVNGMDVFGFAIKQPPRSIKELIETFNIDVETVDLLLLHQANKFIDEKIRKAIKIPAEKTPYCLEEYGNVTSASIPLTMVSRCRERLAGDMRHCIACGFGVGLAWASMEFYAGDVKIPEVITY